MSPPQQGTSIRTSTRESIPLAEMIRPSFSTYAAASSSFGQPTRQTLPPARNSLWKSGKAKGVQSAATTSSAPLSHGAFSGTSRICTGQLISADFAGPEQAQARSRLLPPPRRSRTAEPGQPQGRSSRLPADISGEDLVRAITRTPASEYVLVEADGSVFGVLTTADVDRAFREAQQ